MAVVELHEDYSVIRLDISADPETGRQEGEMPRSWIVVFDDQHSPYDEPFLARIAELGPVRVAQMWEALPNDPFTWVIRQVVEPFSEDSDSPSPHMWRVTCYYQTITDPTTLDPIIEEDFIPSSEPIDRALAKRVIHGTTPGDWLEEPCAITNSSYESFDPPCMEDYFDQVLRIRVNKGSYDRKLARKYIDTTNDNVFLGYLAGQVKMIKWVGRRVRYGLTYYWEHEMEFVCRIPESDPFDACWDVVRKDEGYRLPGDGETPGEPIKDEEGNPVTTPVQLNGEGQPDPTGEPTFLQFMTKKQMPFSVLGIVEGPDGTILIPDRT